MTIPAGPRSVPLEMPDVPPPGEFVPVPHTNLLDIAFAPEGDTLYVAANVTAADCWAITVHHWPEILGLLLAIVLVACLVRVVRVLRRPRTPGRLYCRRCNYDVSDEPETCPECGRAASRPRKGKRRLRRLAPACTVATIAGLLYATPWVLGVTRAWPALVDRAHWYSVDAAAFIEKRQLTRYTPMVTPATGLFAVDAKSRQWRSICAVPGHYGVGFDFELQISPDGRWTALMTRSHELVAVDLRSGRVLGRLPRPTGADARRRSSQWAGIAGFALDSSTIYAAWSDATKEITQLHAWNPRTGEAAIVAEAPSAVFLGPFNPRNWRVVRSEGELAFASFPSSMLRGSLRHMDIYGIDRQMIDTVELDRLNLGGVVSSPDGTLVMIHGNPGQVSEYVLGPGLGRMRIETPAEPVEKLIHRPFFSADGSHLFVRIRLGLLVWSYPEGKYLGSVLMGRRYAPHDYAFAARGRYAASITSSLDESKGLDPALLIIDLTEQPWWPDERTP